MSFPQGGIPVGTFPDGPGSTDFPLSDETLIAAASAASSVTVDGNSTTQRSISELIELDQYLQSRAQASSSNNGWGMIGRARAIPPGGNGRC